MLRRVFRRGFGDGLAEVMAALAGWWPRFWVKIVVLLLRGPGEEEERGAFAEAGDFEFEVEELRIVGFVVRLPAVDDRSWWLSTRVVGRLGGLRHHRGSVGGVLGSSRLSAVDGSPWWLSMRVVGRFRGVNTIEGPRSGVLDCLQSMAALGAVGARGWPAGRAKTSSRVQGVVF